MSPLAVGITASHRTGLWPHRFEIVGFGAWDATSGPTINRVQASTLIGGGYGVATAAPSNGDTYSFYVPLDRGTYSFLWMYRTANSRGIFDVTLDGVAVASNVDHYSASFVDNVVTTATGITVATPGVKTLTVTTDGKHASSSGYYYSPQLITLVRTGA